MCISCVESFNSFLETLEGGATLDIATEGSFTKRWKTIPPYPCFSLKLSKKRESIPAQSTGHRLNRESSEKAVKVASW